MDKLLTLKETANFLRCSEKTILRRAELLGGFKLCGTRWRFPAEKITAITNSKESDIYDKNNGVRTWPIKYTNRRIEEKNLKHGGLGSVNQELQNQYAAVLGLK